MDTTGTGFFEDAQSDDNGHVKGHEGDPAKSYFRFAGTSKSPFLDKGGRERRGAYERGGDFPKSY